LVSDEDRIIRKRESKDKARHRRRGPYRKSSSGRVIKY